MSAQTKEYDPLEAALLLMRTDPETVILPSRRSPDAVKDRAAMVKALEQRIDEADTAADRAEQTRDRAVRERDGHQAAARMYREMVRGLQAAKG